MSGEVTHLHIHTTSHLHFLQVFEYLHLNKENKSPVSE